MKPALNPQLLVWWVLWAAFQSGVFMFDFFLVNRDSTPAPDTSPIWMAAALPFVMSVVIRWGVLPRFNNAQQALPVFIVGIACAEMTCFLGIFIFPAHQRELFILSVLGIAQYIPIFARRFFPPADREI